MDIELRIPPKLGRELEELAEEQGVPVETLVVNGVRLLLEHRNRRSHLS
ncbi:toxin-antitoxin system HicB family antitoxin [Arthrobacter sp. zg-ZUI100]|uniref:Toxin-antitoxin system HicB family antitoxin n=1 Tax=Arthrobacter jiangjiafuii TaxID=2817475 RepID=A0A975QZY5_9MICC|nr:toxin-antitoxin system HicB family antitoxin [Arthrobacter jiangjiafuii]MBP3036051.1 toxin-antitoxin system HicB family antitoxin [Arthrobacter jiangjiafuii]MBP3043446.1 toxin-antitoxin system HicB family antitoxin [Arthrobacter jiangjiafuii]QWC08973.1 toxin-antitoxin system HicB family antitoxin [Arthrobacter jiangjiafuii]